MPTLSTFYGIVIRMYWNDHPPPHFHAKAKGELAVFNLLTLELLRGGLPADSMKLVLQWAEQHQTELMEAWELCSQSKQPQKIAPLP